MRALQVDPRYVYRCNNHDAFNLSAMLMHFDLAVVLCLLPRPTSTWEWDPSARIRGFTHPLIFAGIYKALQIMVSARFECARKGERSRKRWSAPFRR